MDTLKLWREAERALQAMPPADPNHEAVRKLVIELRSMYAELSLAQDASAEQIAAGRARIEAAEQQLRTLVVGA